jgi:hypothetical protein
MNIKEILDKLVLICGFLLIIIFFAQSYGFLSIIEPSVALSFFGLPNDYLTIVLVFFVAWAFWFFLYPLVGSMLIRKFFPNLKKSSLLELMGSFIDTPYKNAIILFLVLLCSGISFTPLVYPAPIGNAPFDKAMNWILFWFVLIKLIFIYPNSVLSIIGLASSKKQA